MRVFVLSSVPAVRAGLAAVLRANAAVDVVGEEDPVQGTPTASSRNSPQASAGNSPDTAIPMETDIIILDLDGIEDIEAVERWVAELRPTAGMLVLAAAGAEGVRGRANPAAARLLEELARRLTSQELAFGAVLRDATGDEIRGAAQAVAQGLIVLDRRIAQDVLAAPERVSAEMERAPDADETLTAREREVLQLMAQGLPNKLIANRLHISEHTAKFHVSAILLKLGAASRTEAVSTAARRGLLIL